MRVPWRDQRGRFLPIKAVVLVLCLVPGLVIAGQWLARDLGAMPVTAAIHETGLWAVRFFLVSLLVSPLRVLVNWPQLLLVRRMLGVTAMGYGLVHLLLYVVEQKYRLGVVISEILARFYLTIGFVALLGLVALGATSTNAAIRRMGVWWKRLHRLGYVFGVVLLLHFFIQAKADISEAAYAAGLYLWLMTWRVLPEGWRGRGWALVAQAGAAWGLTAGLEVLWYGLTSRVPVDHVALANFSLEAGVRPGQWVFVTALVLTALVAGGRWWARVVASAYPPRARA